MVITVLGFLSSGGFIWSSQFRQASRIVSRQTIVRVEIKLKIITKMNKC
jgi:hypothetical protein